MRNGRLIFSSVSSSTPARLIHGTITVYSEEHFLPVHTSFSRWCIFSWPISWRWKATWPEFCPAAQEFTKALNLEWTLAYSEVRFAGSKGLYLCSNCTRNVIQFLFLTFLSRNSTTSRRRHRLAVLFTLWIEGWICEGRRVRCRERVSRSAGSVKKAQLRIERKIVRNILTK